MKLFATKSILVIVILYWSASCFQSDFNIGNRVLLTYSGLVMSIHVPVLGSVGNACHSKIKSALVGRVKAIV